MQKTTINIELDLSVDDGNLKSWEEIEKLIADIEHTCNKRGYDLRDHTKTIGTIFDNDEELLSVEDMKI